MKLNTEQATLARDALAKAVFMVEKEVDRFKTLAQRIAAGLAYVYSSVLSYVIQGRFLVVMALEWH